MAHEQEEVGDQMILQAPSCKHLSKTQEVSDLCHLHPKPTAS